MSTTSLLRQLDRYRDTDSREMSPSEYMLVVVQLSDGYSRRAIELTKVSNGNGGFRISERDIVKARDERRNMIREIKNGSAWGNLVFPSSRSVYARCSTCRYRAFARNCREVPVGERDLPQKRYSLHSRSALERSSCPLPNERKPKRMRRSFVGRRNRAVSQ